MKLRRILSLAALVAAVALAASACGGSAGSSPQSEATPASPQPVTTQPAPQPVTTQPAPQPTATQPSPSTAGPTTEVYNDGFGIQAGATSDDIANVIVDPVKSNFGGWRTYDGDVLYAAQSATCTPGSTDDGYAYFWCNVTFGDNVTWSNVHVLANTPGTWGADGRSRAVRSS